MTYGTHWSASYLFFFLLSLPFSYTHGRVIFLEVPGSQRGIGGAGGELAHQYAAAGPEAGPLLARVLTRTEAGPLLTRVLTRTPEAGDPQRARRSKLPHAVAVRFSCGKPPARKLTPGFRLPFLGGAPPAWETLRPLLLLPCRLSQNPKPHTPPQLRPLPPPSKQRRRWWQCRHGRSVGFDFVGELASRGRHPPQERSRGNPRLPPVRLYPQPHFLEFLLFVSTRQLMRPMLFLGYCR